MNLVCWKWGAKYTSEHVNTMARMAREHYRGDLRVLCVTNQPQGIADDVEIVKDREDYAYLPGGYGGHGPSCYRRLWAFAPDAAEVFGERFVSIDLDAVIVGDVTPIWDRDEDFVGWRDPYREQYCGSMFTLKAGSCTRVWTSFNPATSPREAHAAGFLGSDQAWISRCLWPGYAWTELSGVYSHSACREKLPAAARIVFFHGKDKPWDAKAPAWVRDHIGA